MIMTTPNEFLQFAKEMGLGTIKSTSSSPSSSLSRSISNNDNYTSTGLSVLNNLCRLIEQIHQLKAENQRLRAHVDLVEHVDKFQQHFLLEDNHENKNDKHKQLTSSTSILHDGDKSDTLSPTNSLKIKRSLSNRERKGTHSCPNQDDSSLVLSNEHEPNELVDSTSSSPSVATWSKVRHAFKFSLRRKQGGFPTSPPLLHIERQIPTISISIESDDDQLQENKLLKKKKKKIMTTNDNRQNIVGEETDQDDESTQFVRAYHQGRLDENETANSSSTDRQETPTPINSPPNPSNADNEHLLTRKQSKIARYRRKLRSKLDTVKRQFSEQNPTSTVRRCPNSHATTFVDIGSGLNQDLITAQLAPALTKSYQQKMREWETMQKSHFLVNYRRRSITPKLDLNINSQKPSITQISNEISSDPIILSSPIVDELNLEFEKTFLSLDPILSPNQRSLIVHQWREIMSEEISLRHYNEYLQKQMILLKDLETNLKSLQTNIFCTNHLIKQQSMINIHQINNHTQSYLPQRCRSLESFISMPASWILAVESAAYSDILDGTSTKTTEQAILFNKNFFDQLEHFKYDRQKFEENFIQDLQLITHLKLKPKIISKNNQLYVKRVSARACLRKLSLISYSEFPQHFLSDPIIPLHTIISHIQPSLNNELHPITTNEEEILLLPSSDILNKQSKRSRFDLKKSFQRSKSMYMTQFHSWLQRRRQQHSSTSQRRKSAIESKSSTPKLLGSPRLARLHQKLFKASTSSSSQQIQHTQIPTQILDDSDDRSQFELPVRIYFPPLTPPIIRRVRINESPITTSDNDHENLSTPILNRKYASLSSSFRIATAQEKRENFATLSNTFNNRYT